ncbi:unnamed protein product, partial [Ixodes pacificus]
LFAVHRAVFVLVHLGLVDVHNGTRDVGQHPAERALAALVSLSEFLHLVPKLLGRQPQDEPDSLVLPQQVDLKDAYKDSGAVLQALGVVGDDGEVEVALHAPLRVEVEAELPGPVVDEKWGPREGLQAFGKRAPDLAHQVVAHQAVDAVVKAEGGGTHPDGHEDDAEVGLHGDAAREDRAHEPGGVIVDVEHGDLDLEQRVVPRVEAGHGARLVEAVVRGPHQQRVVGFLLTVQHLARRQLVREQVQREAAALPTLWSPTVCSQLTDDVVAGNGLQDAQVVVTIDRVDQLVALRAGSHVLRKRKLARRTYHIFCELRGVIVHVRHEHGEVQVT